MKAGATLEKLVAQRLKAANIHFACQTVKKEMGKSGTWLVNTSGKTLNQF